MIKSPLIEVEGLWRQFDVSKPWFNRIIEREPRRTLTAVADVSFSIERGETFALVGESGSGKSTIAKVIVGLLEPTLGSVTIDGIAMSDPTMVDQQLQLRRRIQMIFQDPFASLNPRWRVARIVAEPLRAFGLLSNAQAIDGRVSELLLLVGLSPEDSSKYPHEFSGGQRQRVAIARALAAEPDFLVCDEPTSALDVSVQAQILNLMRDLQDGLGLTFLFISHNLAVVRHMASRIGVLYLGRLVEVAMPDELFDAPRHPYTRLLLDAVPDIDMTGRVRTTVDGEIPSPIDPPPGCSFHPRCPLANGRCKLERPPLLPLNAAQPTGRYVACHAVAEARG